MKRSSSLAGLIALLAVLSLVVGPTAQAVEEHHKAEAMEPSPAAGKHSGSGMMGQPAAGGSPGMMGMMGGPGDQDDRGMMGMMGHGMMKMMMAHMMGGPGGKASMMASTGFGMMGRKGGPQGMAQMAGMLDKINLTPEQWDQVHKLARERLEKMVDLRARQMKLQIELAGMRWDDPVEPQKVKELFARRAEVKAELFLAALDYLRSLKGILTQDQVRKLEAQGL